MADIDDVLLEIQSVLERIDEIDKTVVGLQGRLDQLVASHNQVGENVAWLTANTQGIFQMLSDPKTVATMMGGFMPGMMAGGGNDGGRPAEH